MTAPNHAITGAIIGLIIANPVIAIPIALASHFICDAIPHYSPKKNEKLLQTKTFAYFLIIQALLCFILVLGIFLQKPTNYINSIICAFAATSPDFLWLRKYILINRHKKFVPSSLEKYLSEIQWFEKPIGAYSELFWAIGGLIILLPLIGLGKI